MLQKVYFFEFKERFDRLTNVDSLVVSGITTFGNLVTDFFDDAGNLTCQISVSLETGDVTYLIDL